MSKTLVMKFGGTSVGNAEAISQSAEIVRNAKKKFLPLINDFESRCPPVHFWGEPSPRAIDAISSLGERMSIHLMSARLNQLGIKSEAVEASELIRTDDVFGSAN